MTNTRTCPECRGQGLDPFSSGDDCPVCLGQKVITDKSPPTSELVRVRMLMKWLHEDGESATIYQAKTPNGWCRLKVEKSGITCDRHGKIVCEGRTRLSCSGLLKSDSNAPEVTEQPTGNEAA